MRAESLDRRGGYVLVCGQCGRRPVDVYLGTRSESGREVNAMRAALAEGRRI